MNRGVTRRIGGCGLCPQTPGIFRFAAKMAEGKTGRLHLQPPHATSAAESALGLRPRRALSSAQLAAEWNNSTSPYNNYSLNGACPLNSLSHPGGSLQPLSGCPILRGFSRRVGGGVIAPWALPNLPLSSVGLVLISVFGNDGALRPRACGTELT